MNFIDPAKVKNWLNKAKNLINVLSSTEFLSEMTAHFSWPSVSYTFDKTIRCTATIIVLDQYVIAYSEYCNHQKYAQHQANINLIRKLYKIIHQSVADLIMLKNFLESIEDKVECGICEEFVSCAEYKQHLINCKSKKICCPICYERYDEKMVALSCGHHLCNDCEEQLASGTLIRCPLCRKNSKYFSVLL